MSLSHIKGLLEAVSQWPPVPLKSHIIDDAIGSLVAQLKAMGYTVKIDYAGERETMH